MINIQRSIAKIKKLSVLAVKGSTDGERTSARIQELKQVKKIISSMGYDIMSVSAMHASRHICELFEKGKTNVVANTEVSEIVNKFNSLYGKVVA